MKKFLLRLDDNTYEVITQYALEKKISLNSYINTLLEKEINKNNLGFEHRNIIGALVKGNNILEDKGLIEISGIYYKYKNSQNEKISNENFYRVISAVGNLITIKKEGKI